MVMDGDSLRRIGDYVVARRQQLGWSQADLVRESGLSDLTIRRIEKGETIDYRQKTWGILCDALHWSRDSIERILAGEPPAVVEPNLLVDVTMEFRERLDLLEAQVRDLQRLIDEDYRRSDPPGSASPEG